LIDLDTHLSALAGNPHFAALCDELRRVRERKYELLSQAGQSHEEMLERAGEIRGINLVLATTPKGQQ
jgi:hypothetical protein